MSSCLPVRRLLTAAVLLALVVAFLLVGRSLDSASAQTGGPTVRSCGNLNVNGLLIGDITAKRTTCKLARQIARTAATRDDDATGTVRGYVCLRGTVTDELTFGRCSRASGGDELFRAVRFDFGS